ncbi:MAG TPA: hypothetical protein VF468_13275 [Actinomycetota bacterium]|nr:hypothetical protein [Actinomycetota bacterium]
MRRTTLVREPQVFVEVGDPQHLYGDPANIFVAGFIGSPPMNMAVGKVVTADIKLLEKDAHTTRPPPKRGPGDQVRGRLRPPAPGSGSATRSRSWSTANGCTSSTSRPAPPSGARCPVFFAHLDGALGPRPWVVEQFPRLPA